MHGGIAYVAYRDYTSVQKLTIKNRTTTKRTGFKRVGELPGQVRAVASFLVLYPSHTQATPGPHKTEVFFCGV